ncbi:SDR family oxidoreductase [Aspergillus saccharolyticus JOP 1030-1]|uniref:Short chain dehydrogenase/reductase family n=1 Tax=Aspergillus saccharolyticus JOP 1030-1 TaxID=1450539 RepID=A0A318Z9F4_9EURO|nr:short chain dehydrogenase/reductase family [Aspergillus saccharolyticus JOP 1030-1]PYH43859.1 short chain dehydrogenase/reductase family [Aspergillus saccharolyticus JOP 1030-1]
MSHLRITELFSVEGLVAVITGGGSGLGRIMAHALAENGASKIFIIGRRQEALQETASLSSKTKVIIPIQADISSKESLQDAYDAIAAQTEHVDLLIANSGILGPINRPPGPKPDGSSPSLFEIREQLWSASMDEFTKVFDVNVTGAYFTVLAFLPLLEAANKRRPAPVKNQPSAPTAQVIITSSIAGFNRRVPFSVAYNLSKASTNQLIKILATVLSSYDIRVNGIAPGLYLSEMSTSTFPEGDKGISDGSFPRDMIPLTRAGSEQDMASLILWMAGPSGAYLNGNITITDGGRVSAVPCTY